MPFFKRGKQYDKLIREAEQQLDQLPEDSTSARVQEERWSLTRAIKNWQERKKIDGDETVAAE